MAGRLTASVVVRHPDHGVKILAVGSELPAWAAGLVPGRLLDTEEPAGAPTSPEEPASSAATEPQGGEVPSAPTDAAAGQADASVEDEVPAAASEPAVEPTPSPTAVAGDVPQPPRAGRGSSLEAWTAYATHLGVAVPESATRDEVIELALDHLES